MSDDKLIKSAASQRIRLPSNRFLRCQYAKKRPINVFSFVLDGQEYGIELSKVKETRRFESVTTLANMPAFIKGVISLGNSQNTSQENCAVPVIDLRARFKQTQIQCNGLTEVIVVNLGDRFMGFIVDRISDIFMTDSTKMSSVPVGISSFNAQFLYGLITLNDRMLILIDIVKLLSDEALMSDTEMAALAMLSPLVEEEQLA